VKPFLCVKERDQEMTNPVIDQENNSKTNQQWWCCLCFKGKKRAQCVRVGVVGQRNKVRAEF
jgi:hypothetical protein